MHDMLPHLIQTDFPSIQRTQLDTLQANLGYRCNQSCLHCHVAASPKRTEEMDWATMQLMLDFIEKFGITTLDLTGGAPEMNQHFKRLVIAARKLGVKVIDRCNLTILCEPGYEDFAEFLAEHDVEVVASLPCYLEDNVDAQRGDGVFQASIDGLKQLNQLGYAQDGSGKVLNLVYNPPGPVLPPEQQALETNYKYELNARYGVQFSNLFTLANMPIQRFGSTLISKKTFIPYMELLRNSFNAATLDSLMCRSLISVDWQGYVHDCDFNQQLKMPLGSSRAPVHLESLLEDGLPESAIRIGDHCYGCTAGQGSSCGGALNA
ncbi:arsenosugar biosynthesis radical SAM (seleno)protein ArsS [Neptunomonas qingdaonensis]|uniref:Radical SAM/Cys-rich domain-containing protein n=1 Tax=Neptunomonas qingdaonensis TaxID=1045558 RepID=A0A1I2P100_9GAMM|nr:arsenosugar biosynthesis radical SAM (seleno)protein ArsS [Neptunomonas qingdaonensis]SFG07131.1 radical SAM/Cys-rich domain-containing protein [Neptunomonas qingdaonensis]